MTYDDSYPQLVKPIYFQYCCNHSQYVTRITRININQTYCFMTFHTADRDCMSTKFHNETIRDL